MDDYIINELIQVYYTLKEIQLRLTAIEWEIPISIPAYNDKTVKTLEETFNDFEIDVKD
jgi:hypothetical protein